MTCDMDVCRCFGFMRWTLFSLARSIHILIHLCALSYCFLSSRFTYLSLSSFQQTPHKVSNSNSVWINVFVEREEKWDLGVLKGNKINTGKSIGNQLLHKCAYNFMGATANWAKNFHNYETRQFSQRYYQNCCNFLLNSCKLVFISLVYRCKFVWPIAMQHRRHRFGR